MLNLGGVALSNSGPTVAVRCLLAWTGAGRQYVLLSTVCMHVVTTQGMAYVEVAGGLLHRRLKARGVEHTKLRGVAQ